MNTNTEDRQAAFNFFVNAIREQGGPATNDDTAAGSCVYLHSHTGKRCGIGHMIAPVYSPLLEGKTISGIVTLAGALGAAGTEAALAAQRVVDHIKYAFDLDARGFDGNFLLDMQMLHDAATSAASDRPNYMDWAGGSSRPAPRPFMDVFEELARNFSLTYSLTYPAPNQPNPEKENA